MKILVLGARGMAGHMITKYMVKRGYDVRTMARAGADYNFDVENQNQVHDFFINFPNSFDYVINCIGLLVKNSIDRPDSAAIINSWFPHYVERKLKDTKTRLIHLSTDCVYDGKDGPYKENAPHTELNAYGRSKSLGEINNDKDITMRMSIIGTEIRSNGVSLINWILNSKETELNGWVDHYWNGITTLQLAKSIDLYMSNPVISGIYNVVNNDVNIDKYNLVKKIVQHWGLNKTVKKTTGPSPANKILVDTRQTFNFMIPDYDTQLEELKNFK